MNTKDNEDVRTLPCKLTDDELTEYSAKLARATVKHEELTQEKKDTTSEFNTRLKHYKTQIDYTASLVDNQTEEREVKVLITKDFDNGRYMERRLDTNEITIDRDLRDDERQPDLPLEETQSEA